MRRMTPCLIICLGSGEAIALYELPGILSQAKTLMQDPDALKALTGLGLGALGTKSVAPGIGRKI